MFYAVAGVPVAFHDIAERIADAEDHAPVIGDEGVASLERFLDVHRGRYGSTAESNSARTASPAVLKMRPRPLPTKSAKISR